MFAELLSRIARALREAKLPYMIIGGQAVLIYAEPRLTRDIDIALGISIEEYSQLDIVCKRCGFKKLINHGSTFVRETNVLPVVDVKSNTRIDFIFSDTSYERAAIQKANTILIDGTKVKVAQPEDVIIHKMIAGRPRDLEDVSSILIKQKKMNIKYIRKILKDFEEHLGISYIRPFNRIITTTKRVSR